MDLIALDTAREKISKDITKTMQTEGQKKKKRLKKNEPNFSDSATTPKLTH